MKTKILTFIFSTVVCSYLSGQTIVSTTTSKKAALLEEFTGIYCTYCPDGHKIANNLIVANPGKVFAINIHTGSYANPQNGDPDFRTAFGTSIAGQTGLTGYPAGTISRRTFGASKTSLSRGDWTSKIPTVIGENSPVNIAIDASIDINTRVLTVLVELYYTDVASAGTINKLNVALLQDSVIGPQTGASTFYPVMLLPNGKYKHNHMLRHLLTGQWGEDITVTAGFITKTYTYTIPANLNNIDFKLPFLSVVAFITKTQQEVITATKDDSLVDITKFANLTVSSTTPARSGYCNNEVTPTLNIKNVASQTVTSFKASYRLDGGTAVEKTFSGGIATGITEVLTFPKIDLSDGYHTISYGELTDINTSLSNIAISSPNNELHTYQEKIQEVTSDFVFMEDFESTAGYAFASSLYPTYTVSSSFSVLDPANVSSRTEVGGFGNSKKSLRIRCFNLLKGEIVTFNLPRFNFSNNSAKIIFSYAHAMYDDNTSEKLELEVSIDCGVNWTSIWSKSGSNLSTTINSKDRFYPTKDTWKKDSVMLDSYTGEGDVLIRFKTTSAYGNNIYIDDINIIKSKVNSVKNVVIEESSLSVYPNPAKEEITISLNTIKSANVSINVFDLIGKKVYNKETYANGILNEIIDIKDLELGVYFISVGSNEQQITKKIVKK